MTPRTLSKAIAPDCTIEELRNRVKGSPFSRFPVIDEGDHVHGYLYKADLINLSADSDLMTLVRPVKQVKAANNIELVFAEMLRERQHLAVVCDELETWLGLVTMEDILETLLGTEIMDETDKVSNLRRYAKQRWTRKARKPIT
ncbi:CBS domain-containing protein [Marinobacter salicampi]|uniref:CBS domain-containing protein n=1 Tax=Marinobacter salicampi TaxID=435907 RepID=UPI001F5FC7C3|nr:CBS domain-containing protein [Marinobacter salicampi]